MEKTKQLREEIKKLQAEENDIMQKLNKTKNKYNTFTSSDKYDNIGYNRNKKNNHTFKQYEDF